MKSKDLQARLLYSARLSFKIEGEISNFQDKKKLKEFVTTKPLLQKMFKGLLEEEGEGEQEEQEQGEKMEAHSLNTVAPQMYLSIITLNVNGLNAPTKRHWVAEWIRKQDPHICYLQQTHLRTKHLHRLNVKGWKKNIPSKWT